ncbi:alpha/beta fold hydrolase [Tsukamurella sp. 8F]|uniref:alpha/beta hydrolase family protein n=1 Tax=unclassified Tsukamurella TaxID=2633480 RepID=UPI0023B9629A|nr:MULTISPECIES: alpha/beta fold hydrolase [unclassified Tsukamurella]MDF0530839.1 alpha/beta fold hydrolase [Tsukamurella sp. 8J]MDF0588216.1 alpha/beta fold hydrolase [Tsukamurella sp. 8F]
MTWFSLHEPDGEPRAVAILAHGAGANRDAVILRTVAESLADRGVRVVRIDLPFRRTRPKGPPSPAGQAADRAAFAEATERFAGPDHRLLWGGHSYGGRMASMAAAEGPTRPDGLILLSYPLHPPKRPEKLRIEHLPSLTVPTLFVHGRRDPFATADELAEAAALVPAKTRTIELAAAHDLAPTRSRVGELTADAMEDFWL